MAILFRTPDDDDRMNRLKDVAKTGFGGGILPL